jgi:hypothetical protein
MSTAMYAPYANALIAKVNDVLAQNGLTKAMLMGNRASGDAEWSIKVTPTGAHTDRVILTLDADAMTPAFIVKLMQEVTGPITPPLAAFLDKHIFSAMSASTVLMIGCDGPDVEVYVEHAETAEGGMLRSYDIGKGTYGIYNHVPRRFHGHIYQQFERALHPEAYATFARILPQSNLAHAFERTHPDYAIAYHMSAVNGPSIKSIAADLRALGRGAYANGAALDAFIATHMNDVLVWLSLSIHVGRPAGRYSVTVYVRPASWYERLTSVLKMH